MTIRFVLGIEVFINRISYIDTKLLIMFIYLFYVSSCELDFLLQSLKNPEDSFQEVVGSIILIETARFYIV